MPKYTLHILIAFCLVLVTACGGDDDEKSNNATANNATTNNGTTNNETSPNTATGDAGMQADGGEDAGTETDAGGEQCQEGEAFDAPLDACITCPSTAYDCDTVITLIDLDAGTATFTFEPAAEDASIVSATLGVRTNDENNMNSQEFEVTGTLDGRTMSFDISDHIDAPNFQLYNLTFEDSCGDSFDITFVANYTSGGTEVQPTFCPLGG